MFYLKIKLLKRFSRTMTNIFQIWIYQKEYKILIILLLSINFLQPNTIYTHNHPPIIILYMHQLYPLYLLVPILLKTTILKNLRSKKIQNLLIIIILLSLLYLPIVPPKTISIFPSRILQTIYGVII